MTAWDGAVATGRKLYFAKKKSFELFKQRQLALAYERELARYGIKRADVAHQIRGDQVAATHNYKKTRPVTACTDKWCAHSFNPVFKPKAHDRMLSPRNSSMAISTLECPKCGSPTKTRQVPISASDLRNDMPKHIVGVELNDGRTVMFDEPLHPEPWTQWPDEKDDVSAVTGQQ